MHGVCDDMEWYAPQGAYVWLPKGSVHGWAVYGDAQVRSLAMTVPGSFDKFVRETGVPAEARVLPPESAMIDPDIIVEVARKYDCEILGPPVNHLN